MFGINPKDLPTIGKMISDPNGLKEFLKLQQLGPAIFKAFQAAHPLQEGEFRSTIIIQMDENGEIWASGMAIDENAQPLRVLFHWNYTDLINALNMEALLSKNEALSSGQLNWAQIKELLKK